MAAGRFGLREWFALIGGLFLLAVAASYLLFPDSPFLKSDQLLSPSANRRLGGAIYLVAGLFCLAIAFGLLW
jgi:hypothetical protein